MLSNFLFKKIPSHITSALCTYKSLSAVTGSSLPPEVWPARNTCCASTEHETSDMCALSPSCQVEGTAAPGTQELHGFLQRQWVLSQPAFHLPHPRLCVCFKSGAPTQHFHSVAICCQLTQHAFVKCLPCT